jgi:hypothetical protein
VDKFELASKDMDVPKMRLVAMCFSEISQQRSVKHELLPRSFGYGDKTLMCVELCLRITTTHHDAEACSPAFPIASRRVRFADCPLHRLHLPPSAAEGPLAVSPLRHCCQDAIVALTGSRGRMQFA